MTSPGSDDGLDVAGNLPAALDLAVADRPGDAPARLDQKFLTAPYWWCCPGVARETANLVLNVALGEGAIGLAAKPPRA